MNLNVKFFATLKERAGSSHTSVELPGDHPSVQDLLDTLARQVPMLKPSLESVLVAVNMEFAFPEQSLQASDEIALFPPVSGG